DDRVAVLLRLIDRAERQVRPPVALIERDRSDGTVAGHGLELLRVDHALGRRFADLTRERDLASRSVLRVAVTPPSAELASRAHRAVLTRTPPVLHVLRVREGLVHERAWRVEGARDHDVALALRRDRHVVGHRVTELVERLGPAKARLLAPLGREARQSADGHARAPTFGAERHERDDVVVPGIAEPTV